MWSAACRTELNLNPREQRMRRKTMALAGAACILAAAVGGSAGAQGSAEPPPGPYPPFKIAEGLYYVGSHEHAVYLIVTKAGLILLDAGDAPTGRQIPDKIRALGYDPANIKILLNTHEHFDHAGGLAYMKRVAAKDAKLYISAKDAPIVAAGGKGDPLLHGAQYEYEPVKPDVIVHDGQQVTLGGWTLTAHLTPGHTPGCTSWTFDAVVAGKVRHVLAPCSWAILPGFKLGKTETYPGQTADYEKSIKTWQSLPCEVYISASHQFFNYEAKKAALDAGNREAFVDPEGCRQWYQKADAAFHAELKKQNP
jgi:metallo-beta-lactamase class B